VFLEGEKMRVILLGAPGSGKGTVAKLLIDKYNVPQISTGDILRSAVNAGSEVGKKAQEFMTRGDLVPDNIIMEIMEERLQQSDCDRGFILDGFPRTIPQAEALSDLLERLSIKLDLVVNLNVPEEVIIQRLSSRRTCSNPDCQAIYNVISMPTRVEGVCDKCGSAVIQRDDETEEAIRNRLKTYEEKTAPLTDFYKELGYYLDVEATSSQAVVDAVTAELD
jgi:adenylate kinase